MQIPKPYTQIQSIHYYCSTQCTIRTLIILILLVQTLVLKAQSPAFKNYSTQDGLITDEVYNLHQDKQGYIWVFSKYGTVKFNGTHFTPVLKNLPIKESFIFSIFENKDGRKWGANSNAKLFEIHNDSAFPIMGIEKVSLALKNSVNEIFQIYVDDSLNIYALTKGSSYKFRFENGRYNPVNLSTTVMPDSVRIRIYQIGNTLLPVHNRVKNDEFITTGAMIRNYIDFFKSNRKFKVTYIPYTTPFRHFKLFENKIYFTSANYIGKINSSNKLLFRNMGSVVLNFTQDKYKHTWIGCLNDGLYEMDENDSIINHYLTHVTINDVLIDTQNGLWLSTPGTGLFRFNNLNDKYFSPLEPLGVPISFIKLSENKLFIATNKGDIFTYANNNFLHFRKADNSVPLGIIKQNNGNYIISFPYSTEEFNFSKSTLRKKNLTKSLKYYNIFSLHKDTIIYIWRRGISYSVNGLFVKHIDFGQKILSSELIDHVLWIGTENGVYCYNAAFNTISEKINGELIPDKETLPVTKFLNQVSNSSVIKIVNGPFKSVWLCTEGDGIFEILGNKVRKYSISEGLPSSIVNSISFTQNNCVLLSTNKGLFRSKKPLNNLISNWGNLYSGEVQDAVPFEKKIYLSTKSGLVILNNDEIKTETENIFFNLSRIILDETELNKVAFNGFDSYHTTIEFYFDIITFQENKPQIKYTLEGPDVETDYITSPSIKLNRLSPGNYILTAFPDIKNGEKLKISIPFKVNPSFIQTFAFKLSFYIVCIAMVGLFFWYWNKRKRRKELEKIKNEQLLLEYKLIALKAQINPHFMSNCLTSIQNLIIENHSSEASHYVAKFGLLVRKILDFSSKQVITLKEELEVLILYIELEQLRFTEKFTYHIQVEDTINQMETFVPPLILNPLVENAIWHGLLPLKGVRDGLLEISVKLVEKSLVISVSDNGVGRNAEPKPEKTNKTKSYGLNVTEQRLSNINYLYSSTDARLEFTDLINQGNATGTIAIIYLPIQLNPKKHEEN